MLLGDNNGIVKSLRGRPAIKDHRALETYLERYRGILLYLKEMDESAYAKLCAVSIDHIFTIAIICSYLDRLTSLPSASCMPCKSKPYYPPMEHW